MTVEEIEILVTAKLEDVMKEFEKLKPQIMKQLAEIQKQVQEAFSNVDMKKFKGQVQQSIQLAKKKIQGLKKSSANNEIAIKVNNKEAKEQISQLGKEIDSLQKKITARQLKLDITNNTLDDLKNQTNQSVINEMPDAGNKRIKQETYKRLDNDTNYQSLIKQSDTLNNEIIRYNALLDSAKSKMTELGQQTSQTATTQNKLSGFFNAFKGKLEQVKPAIEKIKSGISKIATPIVNITKKALQMINPFKKASNAISGMTGKLKVGLGQVIKYAGALLGLRSIYQTLKSSASSWLSSQNAQAQQLSANIDYMKYAMRKCICTSNRIYNKSYIQSYEGGTKFSICF